jgi:hypothetical protein
MLLFLLFEASRREKKEGEGRGRERVHHIKMTKYEWISPTKIQYN